MALFLCIQDNSFDGSRGYRKGQFYTFNTNPNATFFESVPDSDSREKDNSPLPAWLDLDDDWHIDVPVQFEDDVTFAEDATFNALIANSIELNTDGPVKEWKAGQLQHDPVENVLLYDSEIEDVRASIPEELWYSCINNNTADIPDGTAVYASGICPTTGRIEVSLARADDPFTSLQTLGLTTSTIKGTTSEPTNAEARYGKVTHFGKVRNLNTTGKTEGGVIWLSATVAGEVTQTKPAVGSQLILMGTTLKEDSSEGSYWVKINLTSNSVPSYKSETFSSRGVGAGTYYLFGDYIAPSTDITLTQAASTFSFGSANSAYGMRPFAVFAGGGTVDSGQVGLRWVSTSITDSGVRTAGDVQVITDDITAPVLDEYIETQKKIIGAGQYELYIVSGAPTTYSVSFNYGFAKYEDFGNRDLVLTDFEAVGLGGATDVNFILQLLKHSNVGWSYSATSFIPGNGSIADINSIYAPEDAVYSGEPFHFKLDSTVLDETILGSADEGIIVKLVTTQNNTIQYLNCHIGVSF
jgi:hypothetical protein